MKANNKLCVYVINQVELLGDSKKKEQQDIREDYKGVGSYIFEVVQHDVLLEIVLHYFDTDWGSSPIGVGVSNDTIVLGGYTVNAFGLY